jgi:DNA-binding NtrC family response regulator
MKKTGTLIFTGWDSNGCGYAHCAALALLAHPGATVRGVSRARLPEALEAAAGYARVLILGVSLGGDPERLARSVRALRKQGLSIQWISVLKPSASVGAATLGMLSPFVGEGLSLQEAVARCLDVEDGLEGAAKANEPLVDAAGYAHRNLEDDSFFEAAVRHIARREGEGAWSREEKALVRACEGLYGSPLLGHTPAMAEVKRVIARAARHPDVRVLILGESGTGKEAAALMLHRLSERGDNEFVPFNCASSNPQLLESELRGYEKGAFTGAAGAREGVFEQADKGTLFLDEVGELPLEVQATLLRVLQDGRVSRLGQERRKGGGARRVDVRVIAATNRDLRGMVRGGLFREDLFYRLNTVSLRMPALREHKEDIPEIARDLWRRAGRDGWRALSRVQVDALAGYDYPGNVRELANLLERAYALDERDFKKLLGDYRKTMGDEDSLPSTPLSGQPERLADMTRLHVRRVLEKHGGNVSRAAAALGVSRNTVLKYARE